jgi:hypothetical protein
MQGVLWTRKTRLYTVERRASPAVQSVRWRSCVTGPARTMASCKAKLSRAYEHFEAVRAASQRFIDSGAHSVVYDMNVDARGYSKGPQLLRLRVLSALPEDELGPIIGDVLYNLSSALDHLVCALSAQRTCEGLSFPICESEKVWRAPWKDKSTESGPEHWLRGVPGDAVARIKELQPFPGRDQSLWVLKRLGNHDKHRAIHLVTIAVRTQPFRIPGPVPGVEPKIEIEWQADRIPAENDATLVKFRQVGLPVVSLPQMHMDPGLSFEVAFAKSTPEVPDANVLSTLRGLHDAVAKAVQSVLS